VVVLCNGCINHNVIILSLLQNRDREMDFFLTAQIDGFVPM